MSANAANGLRLLLAARKSRKATDGDTAAMYERQDYRAEQCPQPIGARGP